MLNLLPEVPRLHCLLLQFRFQRLNGTDAAVHLTMQHAQDGFQGIDFELHAVDAFHGTSVSSLRINISNFLIIHTYTQDLLTAGKE